METVKDKVKKETQSNREKQEALNKERISRYNRLFSTEDGVWIWNDLQQLFGWQEPVWEPGLPPTDIAARASRREVLEHIDNQFRLGTKG